MIAMIHKKEHAYYTLLQCGASPDCLDNAGYNLYSISQKYDLVPGFDFAQNKNKTYKRILNNPIESYIVNGKFVQLMPDAYLLDDCFTLDFTNELLLLFDSLPIAVPEKVSCNERRYFYDALSKQFFFNLTCIQLMYLCL